MLSVGICQARTQPAGERPHRRGAHGIHKPVWGGRGRGCDRGGRIEAVIGLTGVYAQISYEFKYAR